MVDEGCCTSAALNVRVRKQQLVSQHGSTPLSAAHSCRSCVSCSMTAVVAAQCPQPLTVTRTIASVQHNNRLSASAAPFLQRKERSQESSAN
jgi:hypothetical protein